MAILTKTLKFDSDVLRTIDNMEWNDNGTLGKLVGQLDRKLYEKVNKALEAMGGKWNRGMGGHAFSSDPRPKVEGLQKTGVLCVARDGFFETPESIVNRMFELVYPRGKVLEPSAGKGAIADLLRVGTENIHCVEFDAERAQLLSQKGYEVFCMDFMAFSAPQPYDTIFMNPPFENNQDIDHVMRAFAMLARGGGLVSVMGEGAFFRETHKASEFREFLEDQGAYVEQLPDKSFRSSGTDVSARLVVLRNDG